MAVLDLSRLKTKKRIKKDELLALLAQVLAELDEELKISTGAQALRDFAQAPDNFAADFGAALGTFAAQISDGRIQTAREEGFSENAARDGVSDAVLSVLSGFSEKLGQALRDLTASGADPAAAVETGRGSGGGFDGASGAFAQERIFEKILRPYLAGSTATALGRPGEDPAAIRTVNNYTFNQTNHNYISDRVDAQAFAKASVPALFFY